MKKDIFHFFSTPFFQWIIYCLGFLVICGGLLSFTPLGGQKTTETLTFLVSFIFACFLWVRFFPLKGSTYSTSLPEADWVSKRKVIAVCGAGILLFLYVAIALFGVFHSALPIDLFTSYKEFGYHLDAIFRAGFGLYPWVDFPYPYGLYPFLLSRSLFFLVPTGDALVYALFILQVIAIGAFSAILFLLSQSKRVYTAGMVALGVYLLPTFPFSLYTGLQANWLRYICPLLLFLVWPKYTTDRLRFFLFGLLAGCIFFITPEFLPLSICAIVGVPILLFKKKSGPVVAWTVFGSLVSALPFFSLVLKDSFHWTRFFTIFDNIYFQVKFIVFYEQLSVALPNIIDSIKNIIADVSLHSLLQGYWVLIFYLPVFLLLWTIGYMIRVKKNTGETDYRLLWLVAVIFFTYSKGFGAGGVTYALLCTPAIILLLVLLYQGEKRYNSLVVATVSLLLFSSVLYNVQQQYFPCAIQKDNHACRLFGEKKDTPKVPVSLPQAGIIQRYYVDDVHDFKEITSLLQIATKDGRLVSLADMSVLYYFVAQEPHGRLLIPSLYIIPKDIKAFDTIPENTHSIITVKKGYNYIDKEVSEIFPHIHERLKEDFVYKGSCRGFNVYIVKTRENDVPVLNCSQ